MDAVLQRKRTKRQVISISSKRYPLQRPCRLSALKNDTLHPSLRKYHQCRYLRRIIGTLVSVTPANGSQDAPLGFNGNRICAYEAHETSLATFPDAGYECLRYTTHLTQHTLDRAIQHRYLRRVADTKASSEVAWQAGWQEAFRHAKAGQDRSGQCSFSQAQGRKKATHSC